MHKGMSDDELREAMKIMAKFSGVNISAERINAPAYAFESETS